MVCNYYCNSVHHEFICIIPWCGHTLTDGCDPEMYMDIRWPETNLGSIANVSCPCVEIVGSLAGRVTRECTGTYTEGARWDDEVGRRCAAHSDITNTLCKLAMVSHNLLISDIYNTIMMTHLPIEYY